MLNASKRSFLLVPTLALVALTFSTVRCEGLTTTEDVSGATGGLTGSDGPCFDQVSVGSSTPAGGNQLGQTCDPASAPTNCADGSFIRFEDTSECICIAKCSTVGASLGADCNSGGTFVCQTVTGAGSTPYCVAPSWNLCGEGGTTGSDGSTGSDGTACKANGNSCSADGDCCSGTCFAEGCG
jgi:hypothetical protein